jgi:hypothetical protein
LSRDFQRGYSLIDPEISVERDHQLRRDNEDV